MKTKFELKCKPTFLTNKVVQEINNHLYNIFNYDIREKEQLYNFYIKDGLENFINKTCLYVKRNENFTICIRERLLYTDYKETFGDEHPIIKLSYRDVYSKTKCEYDKNLIARQILDYIYMRLLNYILFEKIKRMKFHGYLECSKP